MFYSNYVIFHTDKEGKPYLYNSLTNVIVQITSSKINGDNYADYTKYTSNELAKLTKYGFIYETEEKEKEVLSHLKNIYIEKKKDEKKHVYIGVTYDCNMDCVYCFEKKLGRKDIKINKEKVNTIFSKIVNNNAEITLYGGEPLLYNNKEIIKYIFEKANEKNILISIITNGINLMNFKDVLIGNEDIIDKIIITLDGEKKYHDSTRIFKNGLGTFDVIINNIECLYNEKTDIKIIIRVNITEHTMGLESLINYFSKKDYFENITFRIFKVEDYSNIGLCLNNKYSWFSTLRKLEKEYGKKIEVRVPGYQKLKRVFIENKQEFSLPMFSYCEKENLYVYGCEGEIYFCPESIGDLSMKAANNLNKLMNDNKCKKCCYMPLCGGGCQYNRLIKPDNSFYCDEIMSMEKCFWNEYIERK